MELEELEPDDVIAVELMVTIELYIGIEHPYELQAMTRYSYVPTAKPVS